MLGLVLPKGLKHTVVPPLLPIRPALVADILGIQGALMGEVTGATHWVGGAVDMAKIIIAAIKAAIDGILAAQTASPTTSGASSIPEDKVSALKWLHLCIICGVATNAQIPMI